MTIMLLIVCEQYQEHLRQALAEKERELAKNRVQLLTDQISPHYIYNSLQSISGLCSTGPDKASEAINAFSGYLRGSLESLTRENLIPFARELEHTQAYLELEKIAGLENVRTRLAIQCGGTLEISSLGAGTRVTMTIDALKDTDRQIA